MIRRPAWAEGVDLVDEVALAQPGQSNRRTANFLGQTAAEELRAQRADVVGVIPVGRRKAAAKKSSKPCGRAALPIEWALPIAESMNTSRLLKLGSRLPVITM